MRVSGETSPAFGAEAPSAATEPFTSTQPSAIDLIEVRAPYCALSDVELLQPGRVSACITPEQTLADEVGDIAAAEAGRHMAILGSVACASYKHDPARRSYYLAERAVLSSPEAFSVPRRAPSRLQLEAHCLQSTNRQSQANCQIQRPDGTQLFGLRVTYKLVPEKIFQRLFAAFRVDMRQAPRTASPAPDGVRQRRQNPYRHRLGLTVVTLDEHHIRADLPNVPAEACAGHFPLYPAVPVAVLMEAFSNAGGALLRKYRGEPALAYRVRSADIRASRLVFAGQGIVIHGEMLGDVSERGAKMQMCACLTNGEEVSSATFVMDGVPASAFDSASSTAANRQELG